MIESNADITSIDNTVNKIAKLKLDSQTFAEASDKSRP